MTMRTEPETWPPCNGGELRALGAKLGQQERTRGQARFAKRALGSAAMVALLMVTWSGVASTLFPGGISCMKCYGQFDHYAQHLADDAPMEMSLATSMAEHFAGCAHCRDTFVAKYPGLLSEPVKVGLALGAILLAGLRRRV